MAFNITYTCDRCNSTMRFVTGVRLTDNSEHKSWDLCESCFKLFHKFLRKESV